MTYASPGPISTSVPSSGLTASRPEWTTPTWRAWQLSVPATGLTHSDQRHPGSNANRPTVAAPIRTTSTCVLSGVLVSSGESKSRDSTPGTAISSRRSRKILGSRGWHCKRCRSADHGTPSCFRRERGSDLALDLELARVHRRASAGCLRWIHRGEGLGPGPQVLLVVEILKDERCGLRLVEDHLGLLDRHPGR